LMFVDVETDESHCVLIRVKKQVRMGAVVRIRQLSTKIWLSIFKQLQV
jgi:hypothetical protein